MYSSTCDDYSLTWVMLKIIVVSDFHFPHGVDRIQLNTHCVLLIHDMHGKYIVWMFCWHFGFLLWTLCLKWFFFLDLDLLLITFYKQTNWPPWSPFFASLMQVLVMQHCFLSMATKGCCLVAADTSCWSVVVVGEGGVASSSSWNQLKSVLLFTQSVCGRTGTIAVLVYCSIYGVLLLNFRYHHHMFDCKVL